MSHSTRRKAIKRARHLRSTAQRNLEATVARMSMAPVTVRLLSLDGEDRYVVTPTPDGTGSSWAGVWARSGR